MSCIPDSTEQSLVFHLFLYLFLKFSKSWLACHWYAGTPTKSANVPHSHWLLLPDLSFVSTSFLLLFLAVFIQLLIGMLFMPQCQLAISAAMIMQEESGVTILVTLACLSSHSFSTQQCIDAVLADWVKMVWVLRAMAKAVDKNAFLRSPFKPQTQLLFESWIETIVSRKQLYFWTPLIYTEELVQDIKQSYGLHGE